MCTGCGDLMLRTKQSVWLSLHQTFLQLKAHSGPALSNVRIPQIWSQRFLGVNYSLRFRGGSVRFLLQVAFRLLRMLGKNYPGGELLN